MKFRKFLSIALVTAFGCTALASCNAIKDMGVKDVAPGALTYISLRINPEIEMVADENGVIVSTNAINTDGEVVLSAVELEGQTIENATEAFTDTAVDLGFMDPEAGKDTVYVDVNSENAEAAEKVEKSLSDKLMKYFEKKGITGKVSKEVLDSYLAAADEWNVAPGHAKIIARVLEANPELTYDQLLNLTVKDLLELLKTETNANKVAVDLKADYKATIAALKEEYKEMFELREQIDDIEDRLEDAEEADEDDDDDDDDDDDKLTDEEKAALEAELAEKKAALEALEKEYNEKLAAIKAEFKVSSEEARKEHRKEAEERKQAKKDGKDFKDHDDDDDDDRDDDDRDDDRDDDDRDDKNGKGDKEDKNGKGDKKDHDDDHDNDDDDDEEDDD